MFGAMLHAVAERAALPALFADLHTRRRSLLLHSIAVVAGNQLILPQLKRLPEPVVRVEAMRQRLLKQHILGESGGAAKRQHRIRQEM